MKSKPVLSFNELVDKIEENEIQVKDRDYCLEVLNQINYQRLMVYRLYLNKDNIKFEDIYNLYLFDKQLKSILYPALECIEFSLRTQISYHLGNKYGTHCYLDSNLFSNQDKHSTLLDDIDNKLNRRMKHDIIRYHELHYDDGLPIYKVIELLSIGQLSHLFRNIKDVQVQQSIVEIYRQREFKLTPKIFSSWLKTVTDIRNICAHHDLLFNRKFEIIAIRNRTWREFIVEKRPDKKLYSISVFMLIARALVLNDNQYSKLINQVETLLSNHCDLIEPLEIGFIGNWIEYLKR